MQNRHQGKYLLAQTILFVAVPMNMLTIFSFAQLAMLTPLQFEFFPLRLLLIFCEHYLYSMKNFSRE